MMHENPVLRLERDDVGHRAQSDEVEALPEIESRDGRVLSKA